MIKGSHHTEQTKEKLRRINLGKKHSDETKQKISRLMKGRKIVWKNKISESLKGRGLGFKKGYIPWNRGLELSKLHRKKIGDALRGRKISERQKRQISRAQKRRKHLPQEGYKSGEKHPNWKGGITPNNNRIRNSAHYRKWRKKVFERDNYTCIWCGLRGGWNRRLKKRIVLNADHIKSFSLVLKKNNVKTFNDAMLCKELWDINNGRTLCRACHKKTPTYPKSNSKIVRREKKKN